MVAAATEIGLAGKSQSLAEKVPFDPAKWTLVWSDEFDKPGAPDPAAWTLEEGYLRNKELQYFTRGRLENARVENGNLIIEARKDGWDDHPITSASVVSKGRRTFLYGRIVVRAKLPGGRGTWPAIWTLGDNHPGSRGILPEGAPRESVVGWPDCGEMDILENVGFDPDVVHANIHTGAYNHRKGNGKGSKITVKSPSLEFHEYAVEWYEDRLEFFVDDTRYFIYRKESADPKVWPFAQPHWLLLTLAIGGSWGGKQGVDETLFPHRFEIDYVRYYQLKKPE